MNLVLLAVALCICSTLKVEAKKDCQSWKKVLSPGKTESITSHSDFDGIRTKYLPNEHCQWDIEARKNKVPEIKFNTFLIYGTEGSCEGDVVKVWSGDNPANTKTDPDFEFCGAPKDLPAVTGRGKHMTVIFETDASKQNIGFSAEVIERDPGCPPLIHGYNFFNEAFGITCKWHFKDSVHLYFSEVFLKDDDSVSIYDARDMSRTNHYSGAQFNAILRNEEKARKFAYTHNYGSLLQVTSSPHLLIPTNATYGFTIEVHYNCKNFELFYKGTVSMNMRDAYLFCQRKGWDTAIIDLQCKREKMENMLKDVCTDRDDGCLQWIGLKAIQNQYKWLNDPDLINHFDIWDSYGNNTSKRSTCVALRVGGDYLVWTSQNCGNNLGGLFCSRLR